MKKYVLFSMLAMFGCQGESPDPCTVSQTENGIEVTCPDGSSERIVVEYPDSCSVMETDEGALIRCPDGSEVLITDGEDGQPGADGLPGEDGRTPDVTVVVTDPSEECPYGGYHLMVDGTPSGAQICRDQYDCTTALGSLEITSDPSLELFRGCEVMGDLFIRQVTSLDALSSLTTVMRIRVENSTVTDLHPLSKIESVEMSISFQNVQGIQALDGLPTNLDWEVARITFLNVDPVDECDVEAWVTENDVPASRIVYREMSNLGEITVPSCDQP